MKRKIITINEDMCTGCGNCIPDCPEGALQIIDGKARLISDLFCDGLGACIGSCPTGAISVEEREAEPYDEKKVMVNIVKGGKNVIIAHLKHLSDHNETELFQQAIEYLAQNGIDIPEEAPALRQKCHGHGHGANGQGCPGGKMMDFTARPKTVSGAMPANMTSQLRQWPVQLMLLSPLAPYFKNADLVIAADCVPFTYANFHQRFLKDKILIMFCPKLDPNLDVYLDKLTAIFETQDIRSITLVHMEVPCCFGMERLIKKAFENSGKNIIIKDYTISIKGDII